jgi:hypothetical protein
VLSANFAITEFSEFREEVCSDAQPARMMHAGARACMLADVQSEDPDLHPVLGSARIEVWKGVLSWRLGKSAHDPL